MQEIRVTNQMISNTVIFGYFDEIQRKIILSPSSRKEIMLGVNVTLNRGAEYWKSISNVTGKQQSIIDELTNNNFRK